ncbi:DUF4982 domain-containing protein [Novosphingobium sp. P6W]|nr:DUF4982 domain-containing protein [Novosphingobium sp. P6W]KIS31168.1 beta-galactosidase [Novosphingobium sp. P6W]
MGTLVGASSLPALAGAARAAAATATGTEADASPRLVERLADWRFHLGHANSIEKDFGFGRNQRTYAKAGVTAEASAPDFNDSGWAPVMVPHDWAVALPFAKPTTAPKKGDEDASAAHGFKAIGRDFPENSVGWYRTPIKITAADRDRLLWIEFDGVFRDCTVFVNGYVAGRNESGYAPFSVPIGDFLDYDGGPNVIAVRVDASLGEGWFYEGAGIYRHVDLVRADKVHVPQWGSVVRATPDAQGASADVVLELRNERKEPAEVVVRQQILGPDGKIAATLPEARVTVPAGETVESKAQTRISAPQLWSVETPHLYRLRSELIVEGRLADRYETSFGIRTIRFDGRRGFLLNERPVKLLGTCNHQDHAGVGTGIPDALHAWRIDQLQEMGSNAWRSAHNPPSTVLLDLCDAKGMMMIVEARRNSSDPAAMDELSRILRRDRNHPSIISWSLGNEEPQQGTARGARVTQVMQDLVRDLDPTRPTTFAFDNSWEIGVAKVVDVVGYNYRTDQIPDFKAKHPNVPVYGSETGSTVSTRGAYANDAAKHVVRAYDTEHPWWASTAEEWWTIAASREDIAGGFIWTGFDYRGEPTPYPEWPSISSYFGVLDTCGYPKDNFYYYRAWWRPDQPMVHLLPHWTWPGREGQPVEVWVHGNCAEVELLLNGRSLGCKEMPRNRHLAWNVPYAPGKLEARGYNGGKRAAIDVRETVGKPATIELTCDRRMPEATGRDVVMIRAEVLDAKGRPVPDAANLIRFTVEGDAKIIGVGNGDPTSLEADFASERHAFAGLAQAIVRIGRSAGAIRITAAADDLEGGLVQLRPRRLQLQR